MKKAFYMIAILFIFFTQSLFAQEILKHRVIILSDIEADP